LPTTTISPVFYSTYSNATFYNLGYYDLLLFTGSGSVKFSQTTIPIGIIAVAGGGGGAGGSDSQISSSAYLTEGGNGGIGGGHVRCFLSNSSTSTSYTITIGTGGTAGSSSSSGGSGGNTSIYTGTSTNMVVCNGGSGGVYNGSNTTTSSYYYVNKTYISNTESGGSSANTALQGGQGGTAGYTVTGTGATTVSATSGSSSSSYTTNFSIPSDITQNTACKYYYGGGGGGGGATYGGKAGSGSGGGTNTSSSGASASLYGAGGGGAGGATSGGSGKQGLVIFYFPNEYRSPIPLSYMTIWLDAQESSSWVGSSGQWRNKAYQSCSDATTFMGSFTSSSLVSSVINGYAGVYFSGTNALYTSDPAGTYTNGLTLFVVFKPTATNTYTGLVTRTVGKYAGPIEIYNNVRRIGTGTAFTAFTSTSTNLNTLTNTPTIFAFRVDTTTSSSYVYVSEWLNGKSVYSNTTVASSSYSDTATAVYIGCKGDGTTSTTTSSIRYTGYIGEVMMYKKTLSDDEVSEVETFLSDKWGITIS
jgi:hypothetical protein